MSNVYATCILSESFVTTLHAVFLAKYTLQLQPLGLGVEGSCEYVHIYSQLVMSFLLLVFSWLYYDLQHFYHVISQIGTWLVAWLHPVLLMIFTVETENVANYEQHHPYAIPVSQHLVKWLYI